MTSRRKNRDDVGMNLFPFLAVLICTMGSIIMLLVVMVQQARVRALETSTVDAAALQSARTAADELIAQHERQRQEVESAIARQQQQIADHQRAKQLAEDSQLELDELTWKLDTLQPTYESTLEDLAEQRLALSHLEQHTRELSEKASEMQAEADLIAMTAQNGAQNVEADKAELDRVKNELAAAQRELAIEREKLGQQSKRYALVPYDGPNGTQRPPIYIECLPDRVVLQPENVMLIGEDFRAPLNPQNPLAIALRAKREFMLENGLLSDGEEPYPLLVVRPDSASSYAAARSAMTAWESEFGYELVESEVELDYQTADPRLKTLLEDVVTDARGRRQIMFAMMNRQRSRPQELLRPSRSGGFEAVPNGSSSFANGSGGSNANRPNTNGRNANGSNGNAFERGVAGSDSTAGNSAFGNGSAQPQNIQNPIGNRTDGFPAPPATGGDGLNRFESNPGTNSPNNSPGGPGNQLRFGDQNGSAQRGSANTNGRGTQGAQSSNGAGGPSGQSGPNRQGGPSSGATSPSNSFSPNQSLAQSRGSGWAVSGSGSSAVGVKRPIRIVCDGEKLQIVPARGSGNDLMIFRHNGNVQTVVDPFVDAVQSRVRSWGFAGQGLFWRPVLQVQVQGKSETKYRQLLQLLDQSGIEVTREP